MNKLHKVMTNRKHGGEKMIIWAAFRLLGEAGSYAKNLKEDNPN